MLRNGDNRWLVIRRGVDRAESVDAGGETVRNISSKFTALSRIVQALPQRVSLKGSTIVIIYLEKGEFLGIRGCCLV